MRSQFILGRKGNKAVSLILSFILTFTFLFPASLMTGVARAETITPTLVTKWGTSGSGDGQFNSPWGVTTDSAGNIYVSDYNNQRIQKFDSDGNFITQMTRPNFHPSGIVVDKSGNVFVADYLNSMMFKFDANFNYIKSWSRPNSYLFENLTIDQAGFIYVTDNRGRGQVIKYDSNGNEVKAYYINGLYTSPPSAPLAVAIDSKGNLYVSEQQTQTIQKFAPDGLFIKSWGTNEKIYDSYAIAVDASDNIYVSDDGHNQIFKYTSDGVLISTIGSPGTEDLQFSRIRGLIFDSQGYLYVSDSNNNRIQKIDLTERIPEVISVNGGSAATSTRTVTLNINTAKTAMAATEMLISNDAAFSSSVWEPFNQIKSWELTAGDGAKTVYIKFRDNSGQESGVYQTVVNLDSVAPEVSFTINNGDAVTYAQKVTLSISATDGQPSSGISKMLVSNNPDYSGAYWEAYNNTKQWNLSPGDGTNTVYIKVKDAAGNISNQYSQTIKFPVPVFVSKFGSTGSGDGQFNSNRGVATDAAGNIYVADRNNHRVQKFDSAGTLIAQWGEPDWSIYTSYTKPSFTYTPTAIVVDQSGNVFVTDEINNFVYKFGPDFNFIKRWNYNYPTGIAVDSNSNVYVTDYHGSASVGVFDNNGNLIKTIKTLSNLGLSPAGKPSAVALDSKGNMYVTEEESETVQKYSPDGKLLKSWGKVEGIYKPWAIVTDFLDNVYVADDGHNQILKYSSDGVFLAAIGASGTGDGQFSRIRGITIDSAGLMYVSDSGNNRVQKFMMDVTRPTGSIKINDNDYYTATDQVNVSINATDPKDSPIQMKISNSSSFADAVWEPYTPTKTWNLEPGDGQKTVYVKFINESFNESPVYNASIIFDTTPPTGNLIINKNELLTKSTAVNLAINASDNGSGVDQMMISNEPDFTGAEWESYAASKPWNLTSTEGTKTIYAKFKDKAGFESDVVQANIDYYSVSLGSISGGVVIENGLASDGIKVSVYDAADQSRLLGQADVSGGFYKINDLPPGDYKVKFEWNGLTIPVIGWYDNASDYNSANIVTVTAGNDISNINGQIGLPSLMTVETPAQDATVNSTVVFSGWAINPSGIATLQVAKGDGTLLGYATTGIDRSEIAALYPGYPDGNHIGFTYNLNSRLLANGPQTIKITAIGFNGEKTEAFLNLNINNQAQGNGIWGTVTGNSGQPLSDVYVEIYDAGDSSVQKYVGLTDANGYYSVDNAPEGNYKVLFWPYWYNANNRTNYLTSWYGGQPDFATAAVVSGNGEVSAQLTEGGSISGRVTDQQGNPLQYVLVSAYGETNPNDVVSYNQTDENGNYILRGLPDGNYKVEISGQSGVYGMLYQGTWYDNKNDFFGATVVSVTNGTDTPGIDASLAKFGSISGTVRGSNGAALTGIDVVLFDAANNYIAYATTWQNGTYTFEGLEPGKYKIAFDTTSYNSDTNIYGYAPEFYNKKADIDSADLIDISQSQDVDVSAQLAPYGGIAGTVKDSLGINPLPNILVSAYDADGNIVQSVFTDASGRYSLNQLTAGSYKIQFNSNTDLGESETANSYITNWYSNKFSFEEALPVEVTAGAFHNNINAQLSSAGFISGRVTGTDNKPVACIQVTAFTDNGPIVNATTDYNGYYRIANLTPGTYKVNFDASLYNETSADTGYINQWYGNTTDPLKAKSVTVTAGIESGQINVTLQLGTSISGIVTGRYGEALPGVMVYAYDQNMSMQGIASADITGTYNLKGLPAGSYKILFSPIDATDTSEYAAQWYNKKSTFAQAGTVSTAAGQIKTGINCSLDGGGTISGRVTDGNNNPLQGIDIGLVTPDGLGAGHNLSDGNGNYNFIGLPDGAYKVVFFTDYYNENNQTNYVTQWYNQAADISSANDVIISSGKAVNGINGILRTGGSISGLVTDPYGYPIPFAEVDLYTAGSDGPVNSAITGDDGKYYFRGISPGNYQVKFTASIPNDPNGLLYGIEWFNNQTLQGSAQIITVAANSSIENINAQLEYGGAISGKVVDQDGKLLFGEVKVYNYNGQLVGSQSTDPDGTYRIDGLKPGAYKVQFDIGTGSKWYNNKYSQNSANTVNVYAQKVTGNINAIFDVVYTNISISPETPNGADNWYKTSPVIYLSSTLWPSDIYYSWDSLDADTLQYYDGPIKAPEGNHTLYYFSYISGYSEMLDSKDFKVDTQNPTGTLAINNGRLSTNSTNVTLNIIGYDSNGIDKMLVSNNSNFTNAQWEDFSTTKAWKLDNVIGNRTVYLKLMDKAGNVSIVADDIKYTGLPMQLSVDSPAYGSTVKGTINVSGWALSSFEQLSSIEIHTANSVNNVTNITLPRQDVNSIFGDYANSYNSGFAYALDTTKLPNGLQTITVIAKGPDGHSIAKTIWINVNNPPMVMWLDTPGYGSTIRGTANVSGWAVNVAGIDSVKVHTAAGIYDVTQFIKRTDVQSIFGSSYANTENSGFIYPLDTTKLPNGLQTIQVVVKGKNGEIASKTIWVNVDNTERLWLDSPAYGSKVTGPLKVSGWALSSKGLESVKVQTAAGEYDITDKTLPRADVNQLFPGYDNSANSGFSYTLDTTKLPNGWQTITVVAKGINGKSIYKTIWINVDNTGKLWLDTPYNGSTVKGAVTVSGWALNSKGLASVKVHTAAGVYDVTDKARPRADVAGLFPGYANSANSGYAYTLDTTKLPNGWQTISIVSTGNNGEVIAKTIWINVDNPPTILWMDTPAYGSTISGKTLVSGWAVNVAGISSIKVDTAAGTFDVTDKALGRADVGGLFGTKYANSYNSGFAYNLDTTKLPNGLQTITVIVTGMNMDKVYRTIWVNVKN